jgi:hypothetical protein
MKDQRQFTRKSLHCMVSVFNEEGASLGNLVDYSKSGVMMSSYQAMTIDETIECTMVDLPNNIGRKRSGKITLKCVWSEQLTNTMFGSGFQLINADEEAKIMFASYDNAQEE